MRFNPIKGIGVPYKRQVKIYGDCLNYHTLPEKERAKIDRLCKEVCAGDAEMEAALKELLTTDGNLEAIALRHYVTRSALSRRRAKFYKRFHP
ncbi:MAG: hypothetical protein IJI40_08595 [Firmicutes bacterium]|nr:hypothetical protein [Bacillota bacterium]